MTNSRKIPLRLQDLTKASAWGTRDNGIRFHLDLDEIMGPLAVVDDRAKAVQLTGAELADVLGAIPALAMDTGDMMALLRVADMLRGQGSRFTGVRQDDLAAILAWVLSHSAEGDVLGERERTALSRLTESLPKQEDGHV
jgi:hypothetical protein